MRKARRLESALVRVFRGVRGSFARNHGIHGIHGGPGSETTRGKPGITQCEDLYG
jgi:hypothetical protein